MLSCSEKAVKNSQVGAWAGLFKHQVYFAFIEMFCTAHIGFQMFAFLNEGQWNQIALNGIRSSHFSVGRRQFKNFLWLFYFTTVNIDKCEATINFQVTFAQAIKLNL